MSRKIKLGTRASALALWQANFVKDKLELLGFDIELVNFKSDGELDLQTPLYEMGVQGIFTKTLDIALLQGKIDLAVHSLKDVPTQLATGLQLAAVPRRGNHRDALVYKSRMPENSEDYTIATSSLRRAAQWKHRYKKHRQEVLRGNINTRVQKLHDNEHWDAALFAAAGIERIDLEVPNMQVLEWMIPAPAQGALGLVVRTDDTEMKEIVRRLNHQESEIATSVERGFLRELMGGCSMPIGAFAEISNDEISFRACVLTKDGQEMASVNLNYPIAYADRLAKLAKEELWKIGGREIVQTFNR